MYMDQTIKLVNCSETNETLRNMTIETRSVGDGVLNVTSRTMKMNMTTITNSEEAGKIVSDIEMYMVNDTLYTNIDGNWTRMPEMHEEMWDQSQAIIQVELLNASEIELIGSDEVDGEDAYKVKVIPDMETYTAIVNQQMGSIPLSTLNITEVLEGSEMNWTICISKESHLPLKNQFELTLTADIMDLSVGGVGEIEIGIKSNSTGFYSRYNEPVDIEVPERL